MQIAIFVPFNATLWYVHRVVWKKTKKLCTLLFSC